MKHKSLGYQFLPKTTSNVAFSIEITKNIGHKLHLIFAPKHIAILPPLHAVQPHPAPHVHVLAYFPIRVYVEVCSRFSFFLELFFFLIGGMLF